MLNQHRGMLIYASASPDTLLPSLGVTSKVPESEALEKGTGKRRYGGMSRKARLWRKVPESEALEELPESEALEEVPESEVLEEVPESEALEEVPESEAWSVDNQRP